jgi:hypothetical protein
MLTAIEICREITRGNFSRDDLTLINDALRANFKRDRARRLEEAQSALNGGETVRLSGLRPRALNGIEGTVGRFTPSMTRADVTVTKTSWGRGSWKYPVGYVIRGVPLSCMTNVTPETITKRMRKVRKARLTRVANGT